MEELKEINGKSYYTKIMNKWRKNPQVYEKMFVEKSDQLDKRQNNHLRSRRAVQSFGFHLPIRNSKGRAYSPEWVYSLVFVKKEEDKQMKCDLKKTTKEEI